MEMGKGHCDPGSFHDVSGMGLWKCAQTGLIKEHQLLLQASLLESAGRKLLEQGKGERRGC